MTPFWWGWPSWVVELGSGLLLASAVQPIPGLAPQAAIATAASIYYERELDRNGWSWRDVGQREVGIVLGLLLWLWVRA